MWGVWKKVLEIAKKLHNIEKDTYAEQCQHEGKKPDGGVDDNDKEEVDATELPDDMSEDLAEFAFV